MDRFLIALLLAALLLFLPAKAFGGDAAQPVFFSMLFPQLLPALESEEEEGEQVEEDFWTLLGGLCRL